MTINGNDFRNDDSAKASKSIADSIDNQILQEIRAYGRALKVGREVKAKVSGGKKRVRSGKY